MRIDHLHPSTTLRARILGYNRPSCWTCALRNRNWSSANGQRFCAQHEKDPDPGYMLDYQACDQWSAKPRADP